MNKKLLCELLLYIAQKQSRKRRGLMELLSNIILCDSTIDNEIATAEQMSNEVYSVREIRQVRQLVNINLS